MTKAKWEARCFQLGGGEGRSTLGGMFDWSVYFLVLWVDVLSVVELSGVRIRSKECR